MQIKLNVATKREVQVYWTQQAQPSMVISQAFSSSLIQLNILSRGVNVGCQMLKEWLIEQKEKKTRRFFYLIDRRTENSRISGSVFMVLTKDRIVFTPGIRFSFSLCFSLSLNLLQNRTAGGLRLQDAFSLQNIQYNGLLENTITVDHGKGILALATMVKVYCTFKYSKMFSFMI